MVKTIQPVKGKGNLLEMHSLHTYAKKAQAEIQHIFEVLYNKLKWLQMQFLPEHTYLHSLRQHYQIISKIRVHKSHRYYEFTTVKG